MSSKSWQRPWSFEEIIENASNWSLAGDAGLLKQLETFSENLLAKADTTNNNLNQLLSRLNDTSLSLEQVKNEFRSLRNTQFIESRVYEDDETVQENPEDSNTDKQKNESQNEESKIQDIKDAILAGIAVVDKYFEKVEVPGSDSEDESDFPSFILKPKDPYADRPLPYVIGTDEWYKKWHVGLIDSSSDSESDKLSEKYSESDSEIDETKDEIINHPVANSTFHEDHKADLFTSSDAEDNNSTPTYLSPANKKFANELAAKLGTFVDEHSSVEEEINKRPINKVPRVQNFGNLFSDEPPPIDDFNENSNVTGLFSGGKGLFDDIDNSAGLWNEGQNVKTETKNTKPKITSLFDDDLEEDLFNNTLSYGKENNRNENIKSGGLFDDEDDELFNNNFTNQKQNEPYLQSNLKVTVPLIADEPPEFKPNSVPDSDVKHKKPVGGVKIMESSDLFVQQKLGSILKQRRQSSSSSESEPKPDIPPVINKMPSKKKTISLFDDEDEDDDFEKDLFAIPYTKKEVQIAENTVVESVKTNIISANSDEFYESKGNNSFLEDNKPSEPQTISLFDEDVDQDKPDDLFSDSLFTAAPQVQSKTSFDNTLHVPPLFDSVPPELDNWDSRSDNNLFDDSDTGLFENIPEMSSQRSGLFDNEPPSLFFESSGIVRDISTRATTDESFSPYASSSRRFSTDIFNEQQSNDSFFITKNETQPNLEIITEKSDTQISDDSQSKIEITPSGLEDELFSGFSSNNVSDDFDKFQKSNSSTESSPKGSSTKDSPGKLKHNLNINVNALIPGALPPKKRTPEEPVTVEEPSFEEGSGKHLSEKRNDDSSSFESVVKDVEVLSSITKARAKIPFKRNPLSRRARQESLRKSVPDFKILSDPNEDNPITAPIMPQSRSNEFVDIFSENRDTKTNDTVLQSEDLFGINEKTDLLNIAKNVISIEEVPKKLDISATNTVSESNKQISLFDDGEDFDDIFSTKKLPSKPSGKSLFDDDFDDDDDVFSSSSSKLNSKTNHSTNAQKKSVITSQVKKLANSEVVEDPLSSFLEQ